MEHVVYMRRGEVHTGFWWGNLSDREGPLGICKQRWEGKSKMNLIEISWRGTGYVDLPEDVDMWWALVEGVMNIVVL